MKKVESLRERDLLDVARSYAREHHVTVEEMLSSSRRMPLPMARGRFYGYLRALGWSFPAIGQLVGKDHTTVMDQVKRFAVKGAVLAMLVGCSSASPSEAPSCHASTLACDDTVLSAEALQRASWVSYECPADASPAPVHFPIDDAGSFYGCLGEWVGNDTSRWHWCCPEAK